MILADIQTEKTASSPLSLTATDKEPTLSFSQLLKGVDTASESKLVQNGTLVLALDSDTPLPTASPKTTTKENALLSLLKNEKVVPTESKEALSLNPTITANISTKELKVVVSNAKEYLKSKIIESPEYKKTQIQELPKTLKGLAELAQKFGIDISKITLEEVNTKKTPKVELKTELPGIKETPKNELKTETPKVELKVETPSAKETPKIEPKTEILNMKETSKVELKAEVQHTKEMPKVEVSAGLLKYKRR